MKIRKFYPRSAIRTLGGREFSTLEAGEVAALRFVMRRGRSMGVSVMVSATNVPTFESVEPSVFVAGLAKPNQIVQFPAGV